MVNTRSGHSGLFFELGQTRRQRVTVDFVVLDHRTSVLPNRHRVLNIRAILLAETGHERITINVFDTDTSCDFLNRHNRQGPLNVFRASLIPVTGRNTYYLDNHSSLGTSASTLAFNVVHPDHDTNVVVEYQQSAPDWFLCRFSTDQEFYNDEWTVLCDFNFNKLAIRQHTWFILAQRGFLARFRVPHYFYYTRGSVPMFDPVV